MAFADLAHSARAAALAFALAVFPGTAAAQDAPVPSPIETPASIVDEADDSAVNSVTDAELAEAGGSGYTPLGPEMIKGQPVAAEDDFLGSMQFQPQHNAIGDQALFMHNAILMPVIVAISLFVLGLLLWVIVKYRRREGREASKTSHNTLIEVLWTLVPALILVGIAVPSISLLANQYETPPEDAITIKATGYQWYWGYTYADNGGFEVISNMMDETEAMAAGLPEQLAVDNRMVVPVGVPIRLQTIGSDVIHAFGVPSLWFKMDAVPGRLNEKMLVVDEPGIYYGQCMELCGARHAYMPISIEAVPMAQFRQWVASKGGTFGEEGTDPDASGTTSPQGTDVAPMQEPESAVSGAPGDGPPPTDDTAPGRPLL